MIIQKINEKWAEISEGRPTPFVYKVRRLTVVAWPITAVATTMTTGKTVGWAEAFVLGLSYLLCAVWAFTFNQRRN